jgi:hypothetical protein
VTVKQAIVEHIGMEQHGLSFGKISDELNFWLIGGLSHNLLFFAYKAMYYINLSTKQANFNHGEKSVLDAHVLFSHLVRNTVS